MIVQTVESEGSGGILESMTTMPVTAEGEPRFMSTDLSVSPEFIKKITAAQNNIKVIGYLSVLGGVFALVLMLLMAYRMGGGFVSVTHISFLTGGAVAFALGVGLLSCSEAARSVGSMWFLAWGILQLVLGFFSAAWLKEMPTGVFCIVGGVIQLVFADLLHHPAEVFITGYSNGSVEPQAVEEGLMKAAADKNPLLDQFLAQYRQPQPED